MEGGERLMKCHGDKNKKNNKQTKIKKNMPKTNKQKTTNKKP